MRFPVCIFALTSPIPYPFDITDAIEVTTGYFRNYKWLLKRRSPPSLH